jgi:hypothetical protein
MDLTSLFFEKTNLEMGQRLENITLYPSRTRRIHHKQSGDLPNPRCLQGYPKRIPNRLFILLPPSRNNLRRTENTIKVIEWLAHYYFDPIFVKHYVNDVKYPKLEDQQKKSYTCVKWASSLFYYAFFSVWCYNILRKTSYLPYYLGGNGDPFKVLNDPRAYDSEFSS